MTSNTLIGTNLARVNYFAPQQPFLNEFKSSKPWITQADGIWNTEEESLLDLDSNGWVKSLPSSTDNSEFNKVGTLLYRRHNTHKPGRYVVKYDGEGEIKYGFNAQLNSELSAPGRDVIDVEPSKSGIRLNITETDPQGNGNYIRNIELVPESTASLLDAGKTFNPAFIEKVQPYSTLRFMDWMKTNNSPHKDWSDRPQPEDATYTDDGVPVEIMVELANLTDTNPWVTMPHQASDEYVEQFASYVENNLDSDLSVYVEYSNEVWNPLFDQNQWVSDRASAEGINTQDWYSRRTVEVIETWDEVFKDSDRVVGVMASQANNFAWGKDLLAYNWSDESLSHEDTGVDAIAIAPYFGYHVGDPGNEDILSSWAANPNKGLDKLFQELRVGGLLENSPEGGALNRAYQSIEKHADLAASQGIDLVAYEGGQHLLGRGALRENEQVTDLFIAANKDDRMGQIYEEYLDKWYELGGDLFLNFNDITTYDKWGSWGSLESVYQDSSSKFDSLQS